MSITLKVIVSGLLIIFIILTGIGLTGLGRPLNTALLTAHKLTALVFAVFTAILIVRLLKETPMNLFILVGLIAAGMSFIALFVTGAFLSSEKPAPAYVLTIHTLAPVLAVISSAWTLYMLLRKKS